MRCRFAPARSRPVTFGRAGRNQSCGGGLSRTAKRRQRVVMWCDGAAKSPFVKSPLGGMCVGRYRSMETMPTTGPVSGGDESMTVCSDGNSCPGGQMNRQIESEQLCETPRKTSRKGHENAIYWGVDYSPSAPAASTSSTAIKNVFPSGRSIDSDCPLCRSSRCAYMRSVMLGWR